MSGPIRLYLQAFGWFWVLDCGESCVHLQRRHTERVLRVGRAVPRQAFAVRQTWTTQPHVQRGFDSGAAGFPSFCGTSPISASILKRSDRALCFCCRMCFTSAFCFSFSADVSTLRLCRSRRPLMTSPERKEPESQ